MLFRVDSDDLKWIPRNVVRTRRLAVRTVVALLGVVLPCGLSGQQTDQPDLLRAIAAYDAGELQRALAILQAAPGLLDPHDSAVRNLYTGLIRFAEGDREAARQAFAQAVRAEPSIRLDPAVHSPSRVAVFDAARVGVVEEFRAAAESAEASGDAAGALQAWRVVLEAEPGDAVAAARIEALQAELRGEAERRQAELLSEVAARDTAVASPPVSAGLTEDAASRLNPGQALAMGLVVPGLGQFYTGRTTRGVVALVAAGGVLAGGLLSERLEVDCRSVPVNNECPAADVLDERTRRPYLGPAVAVAAGVALFSAIDAFLAARRANGDRGGPIEAAADRDLRVLGPTLDLGAGRVEASLLRLRFD